LIAVLCKAAAAVVEVTIFSDRLLLAENGMTDVLVTP
jgi:hypothetical protein